MQEISVWIATVTVVVGLCGSACTTAAPRSYPVSAQPEKATPAQLEIRALKIMRQAQAAVASGDTKQAVVLYREALAAYEALGDFAAQAAVHNDLGLLLRSAGALDRAAEILTIGLALSRRGDEPTVIAEAAYNLGLVEYERGRDEAAAEHLTQAATDGEALRDPEIVGLSNNALGNLRRRQNDLTAAIARYTRAAQAWDELGRREFEAIAQMNIGYCHALRDEGELAASAFDRAAAMLESTTGANRDVLVPHLQELSRKARATPHEARQRVLHILGRDREPGATGASDE
jgi:tetratricopeptide (TPR) repeat protein